MERPTLDALGLKYGTDKASSHHDYLKVYDQYLSPRRDDFLTFLELGWWKGESIRMWREYFQQAEIIGLDIEAKDPIDGVTFVHGSQTDGSLLDRIAPGGIDVIVDDASHLSPHTATSFKLLWPHLVPGGLYFIEDLQVSYHPEWNGWDPTARTRGRTAEPTMEMLKRLTDDVHYGHASAGPSRTEMPETPGIDHVAFFPGLAVIRKGLLP